jgi:glycogen synthase
MRKLFGKITNAGVAETLKEGTKLIDEIFTTQEERLQGKMELFKMAVTDRNSARDMYSNDSWLQKTFALFFLVAWCGLTALMLQYFIFQNIHLEDWQIAFVSSINGGISTKLSTIIDFLFGGAISGVNQVNLKRRRKNENI